MRAIVPIALVAAALAPSARAGSVSFQMTPDEYTAATLVAGLALHGSEDFEDGAVPPNTGIAMNDPLDASSNNGVFSPGQILAGLRLQSNTNGTTGVNDAGLAGLFPAGSNGLAALGVGANGATDKCVAPTAFGFSHNSLDLRAVPPTVRGMSMRLADLFPTADGPIHVAVFDRADALIGSTILDGDGANGVFLGIVTSDDAVRIGRVNVWAEGAFPQSGLGGDEAVYETTMHGVCPWDVTGDGDVAFDDLLELLSLYGTDPGAPPDFDGDGAVDFGDLLALLSVWGPCDGGT